MKEFYSTQCRGIGGQFKRRYTDFIVEEKTEAGLCEVKAFVSEKFFEEKLEVPEGRGIYLHLEMEKINKDLHSVVKMLGRKLHFGGRRIGYAGLKDKRAVTCQRISVFEPDVKLLEAVYLKGVRLRNAKWSDEKIDLGKLEGNKFTITIRDIDLSEEEIRERIQECFKEMENGIANFFGEQRFGGIRGISHLVGKKLIEGDIEGAVKMYLSAPCEKEEEDVKKARANLAENGDYRVALNEFPEKYRFERGMLNALVADPEDFEGAFRVMPLRLRFLFTHAYQSYLYNELIKTRLSEGIGLEPIESEAQEDGIAMGLLPGYESAYSPGEIGLLERKLLRKEGINFADFKLKTVEECSSRGARRKIVLKPSDLKLLETGEDEFYEGRKYAKISFYLKKGSYATIVLLEIMKNANLKLLN